jgi:hypothetical protein
MEFTLEAEVTVPDTMAGITITDRRITADITGLHFTATGTMAAMAAGTAITGAGIIAITTTAQVVGAFMAPEALALARLMPQAGMSAEEVVSAVVEVAEAVEAATAKAIHSFPNSVFSDALVEAIPLRVPAQS